MNVNFGNKKTRAQVLHPMINMAYKAALENEMFQTMVKTKRHLVSIILHVKAFEFRLLNRNGWAIVAYPFYSNKLRMKKLLIKSKEVLKKCEDFEDSNSILHVIFSKNRTKLRWEYLLKRFDEDARVAHNSEVARNSKIDQDQEIEVQIRTKKEYKSCVIEKTIL